MCPGPVVRPPKLSERFEMGCYLAQIPTAPPKKRRRKSCRGKEGISLVCFVLETVGTVKRDAVLFVVAEWLVGLLLDILVAKTKSDMRRQLITKSRRATVALNILRENSAGIVAGFVE